MNIETTEAEAARIIKDGLAGGMIKTVTAQLVQEALDRIRPVIEAQVKSTIENFVSHAVGIKQDIATGQVIVHVFIKEKNHGTN